VSSHFTPTLGIGLILSAHLDCAAMERWERNYTSRTGEDWWLSVLVLLTP